MGRLGGKFAIVTGASRGIGRAIALELAREGAKVALNYQSNEVLAEKVAAEIRAGGGVHAGAGERRRSRRGARAYQNGGRLMGAIRHPGEQRRHYPRQIAAKDDGRRLARGDRHQSQCGFLLHYCCYATDVGAEVSPHHQHQLDERPDCGLRPGQLRREQGRDHRLHQDCGARARQVGDHGQRDCAGLHAD